MKDKLLSILMLLIIIYSCQNASNGQQKSLASSSVNTSFDYELSNPEAVALSSRLDEISGITFHPDNSNLIYAIQDEIGKVFTYDLEKKQIIDEFKFGKDGDYEDIATDGKFIYVLKSDGSIYYFPFKHNQDNKSVRVLKNPLPKGEYESLALNPVDQSLVVLCKECKVDKSKKTLTGYKFVINPDGSLNIKSFPFLLDLKKIKELDNSISNTIKPSAITFNPKNKEWYILSSIDKVLIVTDGTFKAKKIIPFKRNQFEQPEGIAISKEGKLYISSEIGTATSAVLYSFQLKK